MNHAFPVLTLNVRFADSPDDQPRYEAIRDGVLNHLALTGDS